MKLCIIGKKKTDSFFLEDAKKYFEKVLFVPTENIRLVTVGNKISVKYRTTDLSEFDCIVAIVPRSEYEKIFVIFSNLPDVFKPQGHKAFGITSNRLILFQRLADKNIKVPKISLADSSETAYRALDELDLPLLIRSAGEEMMLATTQQEAKSMIDTLHALKKSIFIEEHYPKKQILDLYVLDNEIIDAKIKKRVGVEFKEDAKTKPKLTRSLISTAVETSKVLKTDWVKITLIKKKIPIVIDVDMSPTLNKNISPIIFEKIRKLAEIEKSESWTIKLGTEIRNVFKVWAK